MRTYKTRDTPRVETRDTIHPVYKMNYTPIRNIFTSPNRLAMLSVSKHGMFRIGHRDMLKNNDTSGYTATNFFSLFKPLFNFFSTTKTEITEDTPKKKGRKRTEFDTNKTASLGLPNEVLQPIVKAASNIILPSAPPSQGKFTSLLALLFNAPPIAKQTPPIKITAPVSTIPIRKQIESLELKCKNEQNANELDELTLKKVECVSELIVEHALRRVDLFFYLLVAVYNKQIIITKDSTIKQHGCGSKLLGTQACHSSMFPNIKIEAIKSPWASLMQAPPTPDLASTQFAETLNMTVELPLVVNVFDGILEGKNKQSKQVKACLSILNDVAKGTLSPKLGMNRFFKIMDEFFIFIEQNNIRKNKSDTPKSFQKVWEYEKAGTFSVCKNACLKNDYFYLLLRLTPDEIKKLEKEPESVNNFYNRLQEEIYSSKPNMKHTRAHRVVKS